MLSWLGSDPPPAGVTLAIVALCLALLLLVFLVLWLISARARRRESAKRSDSERTMLDLDALLAEQTARLRMVRELHELALTSVSEIVKQADGARYASEGDPGAAVRSATVIAASARAARDDLRRVATIAKHGEADAGPQPGIMTARKLFRVMREAGLEVKFEETGDQFELKSGAELAIYRILQESLSNALKYGGEGSSASVGFRWSDHGFRMTVDDDGIRAATRRQGRDPNKVARSGGYTVEDDAAALVSSPEGPGITEMRWRAELFGGVFHAETVPGVGFSVAVSFPALRHAAAASSEAGR